MFNVQWGSGHWCPLDINAFKASSRGSFGFPKTPGGGPVWQKPTPPQRETSLHPWERTSRVFHRPGSSTRHVGRGGYVGLPAGGSQDTWFGHLASRKCSLPTPQPSRGGAPLSCHRTLYVPPKHRSACLPHFSPWLFDMAGCLGAFLGQNVHEFLPFSCLASR